MPEDYQLTPEDIRVLISQGVDPKTIPDKIQVPTDEERQANQQQQPQSGDQSSALGAGVRSAAASAIPTAVGGYAFVPGMEAGAAAGSAIGSAVPLIGTAIGGGVGGILGGALTGYGASRLASAGQNALLPTAINQQLSSDQSQHPIASTIGSLATLPLGGMNFNPEGTLQAAGGLVKTLTGAGATLEENPALLNAAIGGAMGGVQTAVQEKTEGKDLDPTQILINTAIGATFNKPNELGKNVYGFHPVEQSLVNDPNAIKSYQALDRYGRQDGQVVDASPAIIPPAAQSDIEGTIFRAAGISQSDNYTAGKLYPSPAEQSANNIDAAYKEAADNAVKLQNNQLANTPVPTTEHEPAVEPEVEPLTEDEKIQENDRLKKNQGVNYQESEAAPKTPLQQEVETGLESSSLAARLSPELQEGVINEVLKRKGWTVNEQGALVDSKSQPVRGQTLVDAGVRKIALSPDLATADTPAHEGAHAVYQELTAAANNGDSNANNLLNRLHNEQAEGLDAINEQRAKANLPAWDNEEYFADQQGMTFVKRQFNLDNENGWQRWWNDTKALLKTRWNTGNATLDDLRRAINYKMVNDSRFGAIGKAGGVGGGVRFQPASEKPDDNIRNIPNGLLQLLDREYESAKQELNKLGYNKIGGENFTLNNGKDISIGEARKILPPEHIPALDRYANALSDYRRAYSKNADVFKELVGRVTARDSGEPKQSKLDVEQGKQNLDKVYQQLKDAKNQINEHGADFAYQLQKDLAEEGSHVSVQEAYMMTTLPEGQHYLRHFFGDKGEEYIKQGTEHQAKIDKLANLKKLIYDLESNYRATRNQSANEGLTPEDRKAIRKSGKDQPSYSTPYPFKLSELERGDEAINELDYRAQMTKDERAAKQREAIASIDIPEENIRNQPKDEGLETNHMGVIGRPFQAALDTIREIPHPSAKLVGNALHQTFIDRDHIIGKQWNSIADIAKKAGLTKADNARLAEVFRKERENGSSQSQMLQNSAQRQVYRAVKDSLQDNYEYRLANKEPVYRNGVPTMPRRDEFYSPTTTNPKVAQVYRANTDTAEIARLNKEFVSYQMKKLGLSQADAEDNLKNFIDRMQGNSKSGLSNNAYFAGARRAQGEALPPEFTRPGFMANLESYFRNQAMDNAYYKNVESNSAVMAALGERHDAWLKPIPEDPNGPIAGNQAVRNVLNSIRGEATGGTQGAVIAKSESLATAALLGPLTEFHKLVSNAFKQFTYADNPLQAARVFAHAATNIGEGWTHAKENGKIQMTARTASDMFNSNLAFADRLAGLTRDIRQVYTLGDLTERWNMGLLQSGNEMLVPFKIQKANNGSPGAQLLMKHLDPSWTIGKQYSPQELSGLASELSGVMHGSRDARTLPGWMLHDNEISAFFKLSSWSIAQTNSFMRDVWTPATKGNLTPLIMATMGTAVGGYVIKDLREKIAGKRSQVPSIAEMAASSRGIEGNIPALAYNAMAAASYAGFGGMLSTVARYPFDMAFKNQPSGATFPLDQLVTDTANTVDNVGQAIMNDPNLNWLTLATNVGQHWIGANIQLARVALNQGIDAGVIKGTVAEKKELSDKMGQLRRFQEVEGVPYNEQAGVGENPYMNLEQKKFKMETDIPTAMKEAPALIQNIVATYHNQPDIMMAKLKALKSNSYSTMPSMDEEPIQFGKYVKFLTNYAGPQAAQSAIQDYYIHRIVNEVKSSIIP